jgi:GntR family transcriptional regulator/MocR family aminotransferase
MRASGDRARGAPASAAACSAGLAPAPDLTPPPGCAARTRWGLPRRSGGLDTLPAVDVRRAFTQALGADFGDIAGLQGPHGLTALRREVGRYLVARGIACDTNDVAIVNGAQQAIDLVTRVLLDPGDSVVLEQPGYFGARVAFTACQANVINVDVDDGGLVTDDLARVLRARRVKLIYTTPAAQSRPAPS